MRPHQILGKDVRQPTAFQTSQANIDTLFVVAVNLRFELSASLESSTLHYQLNASSL